MYLNTFGFKPGQSSILKIWWGQFSEGPVIQYFLSVYWLLDLLVTVKQMEEKKIFITSFHWEFKLRWLYFIDIEVTLPCTSH